MNYSGECYIKAGTPLICPKCREVVAHVKVDIIDKSKFHFKSIEPIEDCGWGISPCCLERYITLDGIFYTVFGAF